MTNLWKRERGQSLVELAVMLPVLLIILLGVIDFGRVFYAYVTITNASREGARYGSLYPTRIDPGCVDPDCVEFHVIQEVANTITIDRTDNITVTSDTETFTVTVEITFTTLFFGNLPYIRDWLSGGAFPIRGQTAMPILKALE